jgi:hypothetical protein
MPFSAQIDSVLISNRHQKGTNMAITKPPKKQNAQATGVQEQQKGVDIAALERIVAGAPDASPAERAAVAKDDRLMIGNQTRISLALPPELLNKVDAMAGSLSITRAGFIKQALTRAVNSEGA